MGKFVRPKNLLGTTVKSHTPYGNVYITTNRDALPSPVEIFITIGKAGSDIQADAECIARLISMLLQRTEPQNRKELLSFIAEELIDIGGSRTIILGKNIVKSLPDAVGQSLKKELNNNGLSGEGNLRRLP